MQRCASTRAVRRPVFTITAICALLGSSCSRTEVHVGGQSVPQDPESITDNSVPAAPRQPTAAERIVEIDKLLAQPVTGSAGDSDRRVQLRAERAALVASGQVPYHYQSQSQFVNNRNHIVQPQAAPAAVTRNSNGNVVNYATNEGPGQQTVIAPNSQNRNLSFLEQMTPTERERYYRELRIQNGYTDRVRVDVHHR